MSGGKFLLVLMALLLTVSVPLLAQHQDVPEKPAMWKGSSLDSTERKQLLTSFKYGTLHGHFRYFFSYTGNRGDARDWFANAAGGGLRFETASFHGFQVGVSGFYIFNIGSSDLGATDSLSGQPNRYEIGLFDIQDPSNRTDMDRLEELFLKYTFRKSYMTVGRQLINTPFINLQDGRMRPTGVEGAWLEVAELDWLTVDGGFLWKISPRSTTEWLGAGESIGIYPLGVGADGLRSGYAGNLHSAGVGLLGIHLRPTKWLRVNLTDVLVANIFNTAMLQADMTLPLRDEHGPALLVGVQFVRQDGVNDGGNPDPAKAYFPKGGASMAVSGRIGFASGPWETTLNYTRITAHGRYLMPREWGREPFYTFIPRERHEGMGNLHAAMAQVSRSFAKQGVRASLAAGWYRTPDVLDFRLNKYGIPSYVQVNADVRYAFRGFLNGLDAQVLVAGKLGVGETYGDPRFVVNRVDMFHTSVVLNYHF